jgi:ABC-type multidrug transport system permease subunit
MFGICGTIMLCLPVELSERDFLVDLMIAFFFNSFVIIYNICEMNRIVRVLNRLFLFQNPFTVHFVGTLVNNVVPVPKN